MPEHKLVGHVVDADSGRALPARVYVTGANGTRHYPSPSLAHPAKRDLEGHVITLGKPFEVSLPAGNVVVRVERGPEYLPVHETIELPGGGMTERTFRLTRWTDLAGRGWYSGDLHVHRRLADMHALLLGEDLNVAMPITAWDGRRDPDLEMFAQHATPDGEVRPDGHHLFTIYNQEYEPARSPTGAILLMGMSQLIEGRSAPPLEPIFDAAHQRGGFVDMEKHSWAWAPVVAAAGKCDVYELANNHHWREQCLYIDFEVPMRSLKPDYPITIEGWTLYGFDSYYAYLNCGFPLAPAAGTANGVHPNPLGHCRVYVHLGDQPFSARSWQRALLAGRSFVTTGPMLFLQLGDQGPGEERVLEAPGRVQGTVRLESLSRPLRLELVVGGEVVQSFSTNQTVDGDGVYRTIERFEVPVTATTYLAARAFVEPPSPETTRFAHTGVVRVRIPGSPLLPRRFEVQHLVRRVESMVAEIRDGKLRSGDAARALAEYERALAVYQRLARHTRD